MNKVLVFAPGVVQFKDWIHHHKNDGNKYIWATERSIVGLKDFDILIINYTSKLQMFLRVKALEKYRNPDMKVTYVTL